MFKVSKQPGCFYSLLCLCVRPSVADFLFYVFVCIVVFQSWGALCTVCPCFLIHLECAGLFFYSLFVPYSLFLSFLILNLTCIFIIFIYPFLFLFNSLCLSLWLKKFWGRRVVKIWKWFSLTISNQAFRLGRIGLGVTFKIFTVRLGFIRRLWTHTNSGGGGLWKFENDYHWPFPIKPLDLEGLV